MPERLACQTPKHVAKILLFREISKSERPQKHIIFFAQQLFLNSLLTISYLSCQLFLYHLPSIVNGAIRSTLKSEQYTLFSRQVTKITCFFMCILIIMCIFAGERARNRLYMNRNEASAEVPDRFLLK